MHNLQPIEKRSAACKLIVFSPQEMQQMENHKRLIYEQRYQIHALNKTGTSQTAIANIIGVSQPTISRGLKRNTGLNGYQHQQPAPHQSTPCHPHKA